MHNMLTLHRLFIGNDMKKMQVFDNINIKHGHTDFSLFEYFGIIIPHIRKKSRMKTQNLSFLTQFFYILCIYCDILKATYTMHVL